MAFMAMRRNLDDRQQKRELDAIFAKFDKNQNGRILIRDFLSEVAEQGHAVSQQEVKNIKKYADSDGQLSRTGFESYCKESELFKSLDKNHDGVTSLRELTSKEEMAFKALDKNNDGFISRAEFSKLIKNLPKDQVEKVLAKFDQDGDGKLDYEEFKRMITKNKK